MKDEALDLALEALEKARSRIVEAGGSGWKLEAQRCVNAITAIKQARALDKMADNARDLGLDYEPCCKDQTCPKCKPAPVQEPVAQCTVDVSGVAGPSCEPLNWHKAPAQPAPVQEPHKGLSEHLAQATNGRVYVDPVTGDVGIGTAPVAPVQEPVAWVTGFYAGRCVIKTINPAAILPVGVALYTTPPTQPVIPDALTSADIEEHIEYVAGWNDCRQAMLEMMK